MLLGPDGSNGATTLVTTLTSMVGIALGVLLRLAFIDRDPDRAWFGDVTPDNITAPDDTAVPAESV